jgi:hypothetical protein
MISAVILALPTCLFALQSVSIKQDGYLAPVTYLDSLEEGPNMYEVFFYANHTLEQHFEFIGQNLSNLPQFRKELFGYGALIDNKLRDEKIRRDPGVRWIETDTSWFDIVLFDSQEDLCEKTGIGCHTALYTNLDEQSTQPPPENLT